MAAEYTIYAYFNSEQIQGVLNAVVMLMGSGGVDGDYLSIVRVAGMLGLFMAIAYGFVRARGEEAGHYLVMMALFYATLFTPRVSVTIEEHGGGGGAPVVVDNVPLGLAFFTSTTSHIGYWLTEKSETFFALPDTSLRLSQHGLMGGARALREAQSAAMMDPVLAQDVTNFMRDCINPELVLIPAAVDALMKSTNIWSDIATLNLVNAGRMTTLSGTAGAVQCDDAYANIIGPRLTPAATGEFSRIARLLSPEATPAAANTMLGALLPASESLIMTASASTTDAIKQRMMINMLNDTSANMAQIMNDPAAAQQALGAAMATSNANSSYRILAKLAQETLPLVRNAIELVIIGVFPIVLLLIIIAGSKGGVVLRSYVLTMLWVQLWAPLYAIVNYVGTMAASKSLKAALAGIDGVSVANAAQLLNTTISAEAIAGMLTISVPMIALALVKGGEVAMAGVTSGLLGPANSAASSAGGQVGSGNVSLGNTSWGNYNANNSAANHHNVAFGWTSPNRGDIQTEFGSMTYRGGMAGTSNTVGNLVGEFGNIGATGAHGTKVDAARVGSSGQRADFTSGVEAGLVQRTSGQFTQQQGAVAAAKIQRGLENAFGGDWSWLTRDGAGETTATSDRVGTSSRQGHASNIDLGGRVSGQAGGEVTATNPLNSGRQAVAPLGSEADLANKAQRAADLLGQAPSRSSYGVSGNYGFGAKDSEHKDWSGESGHSAEHQQRAERIFDNAVKAVRSIMGKTGNSGERAAMENFIGSLATATDATYGTRTSSTLTRTAAESNQRTDGAGASYQINDNARYGDEALRLSGGNGARALEQAVTNSRFLDRLGGKVGGEIANETVPHGSKASGMDGRPIEAPTSVNSRKTEGDAAVTTKRLEDEAVAHAAGERHLRDGAAARDRIGAPATTEMPSQQTALDSHHGNRDYAEKGLETGQERAAVNGGLNRATEAIFADNGGMTRLLSASLGFGWIGDARTPDEVRGALQELAERDGPSRDRLAEIGKHGRAGTEDLELLANRQHQLEANKQPRNQLSSQDEAYLAPGP